MSLKTSLIHFSDSNILKQNIDHITPPSDENCIGLDLTYVCTPKIHIQPVICMMNLVVANPEALSSKSCSLRVPP
jgi:hypothetical protein